MEFYKNFSPENLKCIYEGVEYTEYWLPVVGFEEYYLISSFGRIKSVREAKFMKQHSNEKGYLVISFKNNSEAKKFKVHRVVAFAFLGADSSRTLVNHKDFIKTHNFFENLEWCTPKENVYHAQLGGRVPMGRKTVELVGEMPLRFTKIINTDTNKVYASVFELSDLIGVKPKEIRRKLSNERPNDTPYRWVKGEYTLFYRKKNEEYMRRYNELKNKVYGVVF